MASLKIIRKRIISTKATQKITKAMKMVAGARLTRAQQRITALRPYAVKTAEILQSVATTIGGEGAGAGEDAVHPLLARRPEKRVLFVVMSSDRGLCGGFNTNINKATERVWREKERGGAEVTFATIGKKGREYLLRRKATIAHDFQGIYDGLDLDKARSIASRLVAAFDKSEVDAIYLVYNQFKSAMTQELTVERLLPLEEPPASTKGGEKDPSALTAEFIFEPNQGALLQQLVPMYVEISIFRALLESQASEFGARMTAMDAATRNAKDMIARLTLVYNRARQAAITKELMEIIGGAEALKE
jgi:F-type H+-transporting ATPase subunit gamma